MTNSNTLSPENQAKLEALFDDARGRLLGLASEIVDEAAAAVAVENAAQKFADMLPTIAYGDNPDHRHAKDLFFCAINLALFLALKEQGVDEHRFGAQMLKRLRRVLAAQPHQPPANQSPEGARAFVDALKESARSAKPGEFVYEYLPGESSPETGDWAFNITSCAICHHYRKYDAMDLVPYMCASDDVMSDAQGKGLVRTGTIALGSKHCDFRYKTGGQPGAVADLFPERIRVEQV